MPPISMKKVLIAILIIILLSRLDRVIAFAKRAYVTVYESFEPLRNCSAEARYIVLIAFLALIYISVFRLLQKYLRQKQKRR